MGDFLNLYNRHSKLLERRERSEKKLDSIRKQLEKNLAQDFEDICIFCCGSLGRGDMGKVSDMDLFIFSSKESNKIKRLSEIKLFHRIIAVNESMNFPEFSNDGMFLKIHSFPDMKGSIGQPKDDYDNLFTTRMLMLLESKPVFNKKLYKGYIEDIADTYFRDAKKKSRIKPLFLLNDVLRFWRTLCLNYENVRVDETKPFRKKNINLKFSRMLTIFSTVLALITEEKLTKDFILKISKFTPMERFAYGLNNISDDSLTEGFTIFLDCYEDFLNTKENLGEAPDIEISDKKRIKKQADFFSDFVYGCLQNNSIKSEYRKYLVI